ncbi:MAG: 3-oxoacyl-[acyl-carrier-protein] synthase-3 [Halioglobus sp.]|jgi:3-oxoacyl-[acyl-carrier-protein] synthase-3
MIGIKAIAGYLPQRRVSNVDRAEEAGKDVDFITDKVGFTSLLRKGDDEDTSDLCVKAFEALLVKVPDIDLQKIDCLIVVTQNPDGSGLPHTSAIVQHKLGLSEDVAAFDVSLGCSGFVYALDVIQSFMSAQGMQHGLLFTSDPYSKVIDPQDYNTELLFGDAAAVTYIAENPVFVSRKSTFSTNAKLSHSIKVDEKTRTLSMLGNNVFKFAVSKVPPQIAKCLELNDLDKNDIDLYLLHQGSKYIVDNLVPLLDVDASKVPFLAAETGNTVSSSIPLMLEHYLDSDEKRILISGFGVGLSWATSVLERN